MKKYDYIDGMDCFDVYRADEVDAKIAELEAERESACKYLERLFVSWLKCHFPDNSETKPLTGDLIGLITQIDNASTKWRDLEAENERMREALKLFVASIDAINLLTDHVPFGAVVLEKAREALKK